MNVERSSWVPPASTDGWLPSAVAQAFTVDRAVPEDLQCMLETLDARWIDRVSRIGAWQRPILASTVDER
jgi:hypothetical protein